MTARQRTVVLLALLCVAAVALASAVRQRPHLRSLRSQAQLRRAQTAHAGAAAPTVAVRRPDETHSTPLTQAETLELMRLRSEVTRLQARQRELAEVRAENQRLRAQAVAPATNLNTSLPSLPPGYVRRSEAQNAGFATPAAALQTFFWAVEHRETNVFLEALMPAFAEKLRAAAESQANDIFDEAGKMPGFRVREQVASPDGSVELELEILPGDTMPRLRARPVAGQWRLDF